MRIRSLIVDFVQWQKDLPQGIWALNQITANHTQGAAPDSEWITEQKSKVLGELVSLVYHLESLKRDFHDNDWHLVISAAQVAMQELARRASREEEPSTKKT